MRLLKNEQPQLFLFYKIQKSKKKAANNSTEEISHENLFNVKGSSNKYDSKTFIAVSNVMSHIVTTEGNMSNLRVAETRVTKGYSRTLTGTKHSDWKGYHKRDKKLHCVT